jgi:hypothetical protein
VYHATWQTTTALLKSQPRQITDRRCVIEVDQAWRNLLELRDFTDARCGRTMMHDASRRFLLMRMKNMMMGHHTTQQ